MEKTLAVILGGGAGSRLYPLTRERAKPAVPVGGKYRLIDIPSSNCLNSGLSHIFVLTQYLSASLNRHISWTYGSLGPFSRGWVQILAAEQAPGVTPAEAWYQGTADAALDCPAGHLPLLIALALALDVLGWMDAWGEERQRPFHKGLDDVLVHVHRLRGRSGLG